MLFIGSMESNVPSSVPCTGAVHCSLVFLRLVCTTFPPVREHLAHYLSPTRLPSDGRQRLHFTLIASVFWLPQSVILPTVSCQGVLLSLRKHCVFFSTSLSHPELEGPEMASVFCFTPEEMMKLRWLSDLPRGSQPANEETTFIECSS